MRIVISLVVVGTEVPSNAVEAVSHHRRTIKDQTFTEVTAQKGVR